MVGFSENLAEKKMKRIEVVIEGTAPLLIHSAEGMTRESAKKNPAKQYNPAEDAEKVVYRNEKRELFMPSRCLKASILNGASWLKFGKQSAKPIIAGCTKIEPYEIILLDKKDRPIKDYKVDVRPVVVQRARIMRARPRVDEWKLKFDIIYNEKIIAETTVLNQVLEEAGQRIGLLDNRPQKYGENGTFKVIKFMPK